jgi:hypothetical protein
MPLEILCGESPQKLRYAAEKIPQEFQELDVSIQHAPSSSQLLLLKNRKFY